MKSLEKMSCSCCGPDKPAAAEDNSLQAGQATLNASPLIGAAAVVNSTRDGASSAAQQTNPNQAVSEHDGCCEVVANKPEPPGKPPCQDNCCGSDSDSAGCGDENDECCQTTDACCDAQPTKLTSEATETCKEGCCEESDSEVDDCCNETQSQKAVAGVDDCQAGCCGESPTNLSRCNPSKPLEKAKTCSSDAGDCCGNSVVSEPAHQDDCCSGLDASCGAARGTDAADVANRGDEKVMDCCRGKPSPCCDESCLDRLALRECDTGSESSCCEKPPESTSMYFYRDISSFTKSVTNRFY